MAKSPLAAAHDHGHHVQPMSMYVKTAVFLAVMMGLTIYAANQTIIPMNLVVMNIVAVGIAAVKTYVVVMYFMHVKWSSPLAKLWAFIGFFFLLGLSVILVDYFFRDHEPAPSWQGGRAESALPRKIGSQDGAKLPPGETNIRNRAPKAHAN
jgi:cytochrome c oxidase subunit IV